MWGREQLLCALCVETIKSRRDSMNIDIKKVNIASEEDLKEVEKEWNDYFDHEYTFLPIKEALSKLNIVVGFGRGFWAGVHGYSYLVYHRERDSFYWYLRDIESDQTVYFYEIPDDATILQLLKTKAIKDQFDAYDEALNFGNIKRITEEYKLTPLNDLFGEDTKQLRIALMQYQPGSYGSTYPHEEYHEKYFLPAYEKALDEKIKDYNKNLFTVYREKGKLYIQLGEDRFEMKKV